MSKRRFLFLSLLLFIAAMPGGVAAYSEGSYYSQSYYQGSYMSGSGGASGVASRTFTYTGSAQSFTVPTGVTLLRVVVVGGGGGGGGAAAGWGSGAGGGCGGGVAGSTISVTPGQVISVTVGAGGAAGASPAQNGSSGSASSFGSLSAAGGGWGRNGYYNLYNQYTGGSGGGSGGGGGGNGWPGFYALNAGGGKGGYIASNNSYTAGGYCIGASWSGDLSALITLVPFSTGDGGYAPGGNYYYGGGGGGGLVINGSTVNGGDGNNSPNNGGKGYGGGGGGSNHDGPSGGAGAPGVVYVEYAAPAASCSVTFDNNPIDYGSGTQLRWTSSNANTSVYISGVGYVSTSGNTLVTPSQTTNYSCYASGAGGSDGWHNAILTVNAPTEPTATISSSQGASMTLGQTSTITATFSAGPGDSITEANIDEPLGTGRAADTDPGTKTYAFTPSSAGTYTFYARATTEYYTSWTTYAQTTVTVTAPCTLGGVTLQSGESGTFYTTQTAPSGQVCSSVSQTRTCNDGTLSGSSSYQYATCSCAPLYSCSGQSIMYTNTSCSTAAVTTCVSPAFCSSGSAACMNPTPEFVAFSGGTGHLQARPQVVRIGAASRIYWNVSNVESCSVTGSNGDSWTGASSGAPGKQTSALEERTTYTLSCVPYEGGTFDDESVAVNMLPAFQER